MIEVENNTCLMTTQCRQTLGVDISHVMKLVLALLISAFLKMKHDIAGY